MKFSHILGKSIRFQHAHARFKPVDCVQENNLSVEKEQLAVAQTHSHHTSSFVRWQKNLFKKKMIA